MTRRGRLVAGVLGWLVPAPRPLFPGMAGVLRAAMGASVPTWYDRHRENWERTGDEQELRRMLRHVDGRA